MKEVNCSIEACSEELERIACVAVVCYRVVIDWASEGQD